MTVKVLESSIKEESPIVYAKEDIINMEAFISDYKHRVAMHRLKGTIGIEGFTEADNVVPALFNDNYDNDHIRSVITCMSVYYHETTCLYRVLTMNDLLISVVKALPDGIEVVLDNVVAMCGDKKVSIGELLIDLYGHIIDIDNRNVKYDKREIMEAIETYESTLTTSIRIAKIPCIKTFLLSQLVFSGIANIKNCVLYDNFIDFMIKTASSDTILFYQLVNTHLIQYYRLLTNVLYEVLNKSVSMNKEAIDLVSTIRASITPLTIADFDGLVSSNFELIRCRYLSDDLGDKPFNNSFWRHLNTSFKQDISESITYLNTHIKLTKSAIIREKNNAYILRYNLLNNSKFHNSLDLSNYGPYLFGYIPDSDYLYVRRKDCDNKIMLSINIVYYGVLISTDIREDLTGFKDIYQSYDGYLSEQVIAQHQLHKVNPASFANYQAIKTYSNFNKLSTLISEMTDVLIDLIQRKKQYTSLYMEYSDEHNKLVFEDFFYFGKLKDHILTIKEIFNLKGDFDGGVTTVLRSVLKTIQRMMSTTIPDNCNIDYDWFTSGDFINSDVIPTNQKVLGIVTMAPAQKPLSDKEPEDLCYNECYSKHTLHYYQLYQVLLDIWYCVVRQQALQCYQNTNCLNDIIQSQISNYLITNNANSLSTISIK